MCVKKNKKNYYRYHLAWNITIMMSIMYVNKVSCDHDFACS